MFTGIHKKGLAMRMSRILALLLVFAASVAVAGIYGTITDGKKPVAAGMKVEITAPARAIQARRTSSAPTASS